MVPSAGISHTQKSIALSSTDAEYMAMSDCSRQATWIQMLLREIGFNIRQLPIYGDNQGSVFMVHNPVTDGWTKHIDTRYHYVRQQIKNGAVTVYYVRSDENPADIFTKPLGKVKFLKFREQLGLHFVP
jgi:hypothetical protein